MVSEFLLLVVEIQDNCLKQVCDDVVAFSFGEQRREFDCAELGQPRQSAIIELIVVIAREFTHDV